jgi:hypothetical protein
MILIGLIWLRIGTVEGSCEHGNEPEGSLKYWESLEWLHNWRLLEKSSAPRVSVYEGSPLQLMKDSLKM